MRRWLGGKIGGLLAFVLIFGLVAGGLGWVTAETLRLEEEQATARTEAAMHEQLRLALWHLDSYIIPELAREASRPFSHYNAIYAPAPIFNPSLRPGVPGSFLELSPLLNADLPDWMLLHFSTSTETGWWSPQVLSEALKKRLSAVKSLPTDVAGRADLLKELEKATNTDGLLARLPPPSLDGFATNSTVLPDVNSARATNRDQRGTQSAVAQSQAEYQNRLNSYGLQEAIRNQQPFNMPPKSQNSLVGKLSPNGEGLLLSQGGKARAESVQPGPMSALWLRTGPEQERLVVARRVNVGDKAVCQGVVLNWDALEKLLLAQVEDLFPEARLQPMRLSDPPHPERTMTALPVELVPGAIVAGDLGWTPLRIGLMLAWAAALVALLAVGLGGWSLIDLSQRRIRFVSTVTHELRTPLTTLRLYLDMLTGGMVRDEKQKDEYLHTLNSETDRLNRLVSNVLDFSRLENQRPRLEKKPVHVADLLEHVRQNWQMRATECGKELIVENATPAERILETDRQVVEQLLGNLIDNACKYSRNAEDRRLWLRARPERNVIVFEVEDRGPGVPTKERRSIFRAFRRGREADVTAGGVGLGLALARRWTGLLGGRLEVGAGQGNIGACFRLELRTA